MVLGNSNVSGSRFNQAQANRQSRAEWRAEQDRISAARQEINALRNSLTRPSSQSSDNSNGDVGSAIERLTDGLENLPNIEDLFPPQTEAVEEEPEVEEEQQQEKPWEKWIDTKRAELIQEITKRDLGLQNSNLKFTPRKQMIYYLVKADYGEEVAQEYYDWLREISEEQKAEDASSS